MVWVSYHNLQRVSVCFFLGKKFYKFFFCVFLQLRFCFFYQTFLFNYTSSFSGFFEGSWTTIRIKSSSGATKISCFLLWIRKYTNSLVPSNSLTIDLARSDNCEINTEYCEKKFFFWKLIWACHVTGYLIGHSYRMRITEIVIIQMRNRVN